MMRKASMRRFTRSDLLGNFYFSLVLHCVLHTLLLVRGAALQDVSHLLKQLLQSGCVDPNERDAARQGATLLHLVSCIVLRVDVYKHALGSCSGNGLVLLGTCKIQVCHVHVWYRHTLQSQKKVPAISSSTAND